MARPGIDDPDLPLGLLFDLWPATVTVFLSQGMACFGCPVAPFHTVVDACLEYQLDEARFRLALRQALADPVDGAALPPPAPNSGKPQAR